MNSRVCLRLLAIAVVSLASQVFSIEVAPGDILVTDDRDGTANPGRVFLIREGATPSPIVHIYEGNLLQRPYGVALEPSGAAVVADYGADAVIRIDLSTGNQSVVSQGGLFIDPSAITVDSAGALYVADATSGNVVHVDPSTGNQTLVHASPQPAFLRGIAVDCSGVLFVSDQTGNKILRIENGAATVIHNGSPFTGLKGISVNPQGVLFVADGSGIYRIDPGEVPQQIAASGGIIDFPYTAEPTSNGEFVVADPRGSAPGALLIVGASTRTITTEMESPLDVAVIPGSESFCDRLSATGFAEPMGKTKQLGATLPVKFSLFLDCAEIAGQQDLNNILAAQGLSATCPEIYVFDVTEVVSGVELTLYPDPAGSPDEGNCFRFADGHWIHNLALNTPFQASHSYYVVVRIGDCVVTPSNGVFQVK